MKPITACALVALLLSPFAFAEELNFKDLEGETWYGLYMNGKKVGYSTQELVVQEDGTVDVVEDAAFKLVMAGLRQEMRIFSKRVYDADGELLRVESTVDDVAGTNEFHGEVRDGSLHLTSIVGGQESKKSLPAPEESLHDALKSVKLIKDNPQIGGKVEFSIFEPMYSMEIAGVSEIVGVEERVFDGVKTKVYQVKTVLQPMKIESVAYVTEGGETLEDHIAGGIITMRLEPEEVAKDVDFSNDVIVSNAAYVEEPIENPRERETLILKIRGPLNPDLLYNDGHQALEARDGYFHFEGRKISMEGIEAATLPIEEESVKQWIAPSMFVQSDNEKFVQKAREIVGHETNAYTISTLLAEWVYANVKSTFSARLTNSLEVLEHMEGDCTEHSMLYIGLARAAGLPAREVAGLIYVEGPEPGFYFHQWAKVWVGKWIDVDPTFDQPIADATHIKLVEGDLLEQIKILPIIGRLDIEVPEETV